jgi:methyl-accepting chemotaxis protein
MTRGVLFRGRMRFGVELRVAAISALFLVLIAVNVILTGISLSRSRDDSHAINLAGRQRMLSQKITRDASALVRGEPVKDDLQKSLTLFDESLAALLDGDAAQGIAAARDEQVRVRLEHVLNEWKLFRPHVDILVQGSSFGNGMQDLLRQNEDLAAKLEETARAFPQSKLDGKPAQVALGAGLRAQLQKLNKELLSLIGTAGNPLGAPAETVALLDKTVNTLLAGDAALGVAASRDPQVRTHLEAAQKMWEPLRSQALKLIEVGPRLRQSLQAVNGRNEQLLETLNDAVAYLETSGVTRLQDLQSNQRLSLFLGFMVALAGLAITRLFVVRPVAQSARNLAISSAQILSASKELEDEAQSQCEALEDVTQTVQSLTESATRISESAEGVRVNAERSRQTTDLTVKRFEELSARTTRVAELLETIRQIAERSDLLALNASLEGSRAGEAGRAFSLVAKEIRRLAEAVGASVVDVKKLVTDIRESGAATVQASDEARKLAQSTAEASAEISMTTQRQRNATIQLAESMQSISAVLSRSTISTRETRAAAQDLKRQAERLSAVVARVQG